ncbi:MAG TPA: TetR/AcrR family transcriptional regulator [Solirubrobacterales bacterium]
MSASRVRRSATRRERRSQREQAIVTAARTLLDERGWSDAPVQKIAHAAGMHKPDVYRTFDSKEEIFVLTLADYLAELEGRSAAAREPKDPAAALRQACLRYVEFCLEYPAFMDCALSLMHRPADGLREQVSDAVWVRLGKAMAACVGRLERILAAGAERGVFAIEDPTFTANLLCTQMLGSMQLARIGAGVREVAPGVAATFEVKPERVRDACVGDVLTAARNPEGASA